PVKSLRPNVGLTGICGLPLPSVGNNWPTGGASAGLSVYQVEPSGLTCTSVEAALLKSPLTVPPLLLVKNSFANRMKFTPNGADGSFKIGVLSCRVISPPAPIETIWLVEKGGANGVTEAPGAGAPSATLPLVKAVAKPVPVL